MAQRHLVVGIDWYGPYRLTEARSAAQKDWKGGLYFCLGKQKGQHNVAPQYVGRSTKNLSSRMQDDHHKLSLVTRAQAIWLGEIVTGDVPGKKKTLAPESVRQSEWALAYFMNLPLNERLKKAPPKRPITVLNRWWSKDYTVPRKQRPHPDWPDVIDFRGTEFPTRIAWFKAPGLKIFQTRLDTSLRRNTDATAAADETGKRVESVLAHSTFLVLADLSHYSTPNDPIVTVRH